MAPTSATQTMEKIPTDLAAEAARAALDAKRAAGKLRHKALIQIMREALALWESELEEWEDAYTDSGVSARHAIQRAQILATFAAVAQQLGGQK